ncbi:MAG: hypothetical protein SF029_09700 [bacterium]|nr:hypothetical protein [bacterium]
MRNNVFFLLLIVIALLVSACGGIATPPPSSADLTLAAEEALAAAEAEEAEENAAATEEGEAESEVVAAAPTETPVPPTNTPAPPTATTVPATPTTAPVTETPAQAAAAADAITVLVERIGDPAAGDTLFHQTLETAAGSYACSTCHNVITDDQLIGPGLYSLRDRAPNRVPGLSGAQYVYNSIVNPNEHVVEGFVGGVMPQNYGDLLSDQDIYNLIAYLFSLQG